MRIEKDQIKTIAVVMILVGLYCGVGWLPQRAKASELDKQIVEAKKQLAVYRSSQATLDAKQKEVIELRKQSEGAQRYVPTREELSDVLRGLTQALRTNQLHEKEFITKEVETYVDYSAMGLRMEFDGAFPEAFGVLKEIEGGSRLIRVDHLKISRIDGAADNLRLEVDMSTFFADPSDGSDRK